MRMFSPWLTGDRQQNPQSALKERKHVMFLQPFFGSCYPQNLLITRRTDHWRIYEYDEQGNFFTKRRSYLVDIVLENSVSGMVGVFSES